MKEFKHICWLDLETFSKCNLKTEGNYQYAVDESTDILLIAYAIDDGEVKLWNNAAEEDMPADLYEALRSEYFQLRAHNAQFDRVVLHHWLERKGYAWGVPIERWYCTMSQCLTHSLPGALDTVGRVLGLEIDYTQI